MSKLTIFPTNEDERPVVVNCPAGDGLYWAERIAALLGPKQVFTVMIEEEAGAVRSPARFDEVGLRAAQAV